MLRAIRIGRLSHIGGRSADAHTRLITGMAAGFIASLGIMVVVTAILMLTGDDILKAARLIASAVYGGDASSGWSPIVVGTLLHLITGTFFGAVFALFVPPLPANIYVVAGLIYGILTGALMTFVVVPVVAPLMVATRVNVAMLIFAHLIYGFVLGIAAGVIELVWGQPKPPRAE